MLKNYFLIQRIFLSNFIRPHFPYKLTFSLTYKCNLRCRSCFIWKKPPGPELPLAQIEKFFMFSNKFSWIDLTGGEIFLRDDLAGIFETILRYCRRLAILHFATNGYLTDRIVRIVKTLRSYNGLPQLVVTVSVDGDPEANNSLRGNGLAWAHALETFVQLRQLGLKHVYLGYTLSKHNPGGLEPLLEAVKRIYPEVSPEDIHINIAHASAHYYNNISDDPSPEAAALAEALDFSKKSGPGVIKKFLEKAYLGKASLYLTGKRAPLTCQSLAATCFIDPYGDIYPCTIHDKKIASIFDINYDLGRFWKGREAVKLRQNILENKCAACWTPCEAYPAILGSLFSHGMAGPGWPGQPVKPIAGA